MEVKNGAPTIRHDQSIVDVFMDEPAGAARPRFTATGHADAAVRTLRASGVTALLQALALRDDATARHSAAVARYAKAIARTLGCSPTEQQVVHTAGMLHDVAKLTWPDRILSGAGPLSDEDWAVVQSHPETGARLVREFGGGDVVADVILGHHERPDGTGYPYGLAGDRIPPLSRIIAVADTYDVLTARTTYRKPVTHEDAICELRRVRGTQLDDQVVNVATKLLSASADGSPEPV